MRKVVLLHRLLEVSYRSEYRMWIYEMLDVRFEEFIGKVIDSPRKCNAVGISENSR